MAQRNIDGRVRALVGGGCASIVGQTIVVPFDVISQHLMVLGLVENNSKKTQVREENYLNLGFHVIFMYDFAGTVKSFRNSNTW